MTFDTALTEAYKGFESVLEEYDVKPQDLVVADVAFTIAEGFDTLCVNLDTVEHKGLVLEHDGHTGPLIYLDLSFTESDRYKPTYIGYYQITTLHPAIGKVLVSYSATEKDDDLIKFVKKLKPGNVFNVARFPTSSGYRVFRPIPVQPIVRG